MATLYEICEALRDFELKFDEDTGEVLNMNELDEIQLERDVKVENIALMIKNLLSDAEAYKREKESFAKKEQIAKNRAERLKNYLQFNLNGERFMSDRVTISYRHSESVEVLDWHKLPAEYLRYKDPEPDKAKLKKAINSGIGLEGVFLVGKDSIQIK